MYINGPCHQLSLLVQVTTQKSGRKKKVWLYNLKTSITDLHKRLCAVDYLRLHDEMNEKFLWKEIEKASLNIQTEDNFFSMFLLWCLSRINTRKGINMNKTCGINNKTANIEILIWNSSF